MCFCLVVCRDCCVGMGGGAVRGFLMSNLPCYQIYLAIRQGFPLSRMTTNK